MSTPRSDIKSSSGRAIFFLYILSMMSDATGERDITTAWVLAAKRTIYHDPQHTLRFQVFPYYIINIDFPKDRAKYDTDASPGMTICNVLTMR